MDVNYPKMLPEIIEALNEFYKDNQDVLIDCLLYLRNSTNRVVDQHSIEEELIQHNTCPICGSALNFRRFCENYEGEKVCCVDKICPNCGDIL